MEVTEKLTNTHELVLIGRDDAVGYHGIIAIHSTVLGPAIGGTRFWHYDSEDEALTDALRLSQGMTYKTALAGLPLGGGKSIIIGNQSSGDRHALLRAHGRFVDMLKGRYVTAEDVGTSPADMEIVRLETQYVGGLIGRSGDPSPHTACGVFRAIQASNQFLWNRFELSGLTVAIQGCGNVGSHLARLLHEAGVRLIVSDVNSENVVRVVDKFGAETVSPNEIFSVKADVFAPCALGGVLNDETIPQLKVQIVAGAANNQLLEERHGVMLRDRSILYAPDYVANAGGVLNGCIELLGWTPELASQKVNEIYNTVLHIFKSAEQQNLTTNEAANQLAEQRLLEGPEDRN
jgi:leucine dehydrogenase